MELPGVAREGIDCRIFRHRFHRGGVGLLLVRVCQPSWLIRRVTSATIAYPCRSFVSPDRRVAWREMATNQPTDTSCPRAVNELVKQTVCFRTVCFSGLHFRGRGSIEVERLAHTEHDNAIADVTCVITYAAIFGGILLALAMGAAFTLDRLEKCRSF